MISGFWVGLLCGLAGVLVGITLSAIIFFMAADKMENGTRRKDARRRRRGKWPMDPE